MARSISDVFARANNGDSQRRRQARFVDTPAESDEKQHQGQAPTAPLEQGRRACYRPAETEALRRDVIEAFSAALLRDVDRSGVDADDLLVDAARAAEAVADHREALEVLQRFRRKQGSLEWTTGFLHRRLLRQIGDEQALRRALLDAPELPSAPQWSTTYAGLQQATDAWKSGVAPRRVHRRTVEATRSAPDSPNVDVFASLWVMQLRCDAALEAGGVDEAFAALEETIELPELNVQTRQALEARRAVWMHVFGRHDEARRLLDELARRKALPGDLDDLLVSLCFEADRAGRAFEVLRSTASDRCRLGDHAVPLVMLHATDGDNTATGRDVLSEATEDNDDWTLLRLHELLLDTTGVDRSQGAGGELIDVLNRRLEGPMSVDERVNTLTRLGRLYELEAGLQQAAAEVYREALSYDPEHLPALRALGRLYSRRDNWEALAELYEREIATLQQGPESWRRHFQLAELYERRLEEYERALENYLIVLEQRPNYLPALKSSARILGRLERWTRLADLFLRMVDSAPNRRQKLYLLDKVAEVAEQKLENYEVAIGAWKEILQIEPENPRAYTALGRLYARTHRWEELIELNEAEIELIDDPEEIAAVWLRNAEIAEQHLEDTEAAEQFYRKTLDVIPNYLPALEALGRIYLRGGRWAEIVELTGRELETVADPREASRHLQALAEIYETRLDRREDAIAIYQRLWSQNTGDPHVFAALRRLYLADGRWQRLEELLNTRLQHNPNTTEFAALQGELGLLAEWKTDRPEHAYSRYLSALQCDPTDIHWLSGVARTWTQAQVDAEEVADELEDLLMHVTGEQIRNRYFTIIARLRERSETGPETSRAYRTHGRVDSLENQIVLRLAMAAAGERDELDAARQVRPHLALQQLFTLERTATGEEVAQQLQCAAGDLPPPARRWFARTFSPQVCGVGLECDELSRDLVELLDGEQLHLDDTTDPQNRQRLRLRALQARRLGAHEAYLKWTDREIERLDEATEAARRLEVARYATRHQLPEETALYREACRAVFPEMGPSEPAGADGDEPTGTGDPPDIPHEHIDRLQKALEQTHRWGLLRRCLECRVARQGCERDERLELFERLAELLREHIEDYDGARDALVHCWQLSESPDFLRRLVELAQDHQQREDALRFQRKHFEAVSMSSEVCAARRVQSGIWLAQLLLAQNDPDQRESAIDCLEHLSDSYDEVEGLRRARRMLANAHADAGNGRRAVELFEDVLHFQIRGDELDDWRRLIEVHRCQLGDVDTAYARQWRIVRAFPGSQRDLDTLVDLAAEAGETADCIEQLTALANATADDNKPRLLARAAEAADEELGHAEEAYRLLDRVLELSEPDEEGRINYERRRAVCLARMAGREPRALEAFRGLIEKDPFEPANYRGMEMLFERANALDRLRVARQTLRTLGCETVEAKAAGKTQPTRALDAAIVETNLMPESLAEGLFDVLQAARPLVEKVFSDDLPQRKALDGRRIKSGTELSFYDDLEAALVAFGISKFKLYVGENGPDHPLVFAGSTPVVWASTNLLEQLETAESRFLAGYCAALVWSELPALLQLDGRRVWHLIEGVVYRETGSGFGERVDLASQQMADRVSSPFDMKKRHTLVKAVDRCERDLEDEHCEAWGRRLELFAARAGLLLSGDLAAASRSLLRLSGWNLPLTEDATRHRIENNQTVRDLIELAHSDEYLELRYRAGLAGRPSQLGV